MELIHKKNNPAISVVVPVYNAEMYVKEAIDSILGQSFADFECIVVDDGSTDGTKEIIQLYDDSRIVLVENNHDFIGSLNMGINMAKGKYIARMDADDTMHPDRLRIQHSIMETEPNIIICGTWMTLFGNGITTESIARSINGLVELPLLQLLQGNFVFHPTTMIRKNFLVEHQLYYEEYPYAEDFKLWSEIAKRGGTFYIENQPLLYYRISENQVTKRKKEEQKATSERILHEILNFLLDKNKEKYFELTELSKNLQKLQQKELISFAKILQISHDIFVTNKNRLLLA